ncbi:MAG: hypothetical protein IPK97_02650 [Ahniella sp.]|nr:hypothetical protein [Ahniella sp.]
MKTDFARTLKRLGILCALVLLVSCSGAPGLVRPNEPVRVQRVFEVQSPIEWARYRGVGNETWTVDGTALNRLTFLANIRDKHHIFGYGRQTRRNPDGPFFRTGMEPNELRDLLVDGLAQAGFANVGARNLQPGHRDGFTTYRFDLDLRAPNGLIYQGHALMFERRERLNVAFWFAPTEHYHARDVAAVEQMFADMHFRQ